MTRILSLDDNYDMQILLTLILEKEGYEHIAALDSYEAWTLLHTESIDLFILDSMLPEIDSWEFIEMMKADEILHHIPLILMSGRVMQVDKEFSGYSQLDAYITKPFEVSHLLTTVEDVLKKHGKSLPTAEKMANITALRNQHVEKRIAALTDNDPTVRRWAIWTLSYKDDNQKVTEALISLLDDESFWVRLSSVRMLAFSGNLRAVDPLKKLAENIPLERIEQQRAMKLPQIIPWDAEASIARWARWVIGQIKATTKQQ